MSRAVSSARAAFAASPSVRSSRIDLRVSVFLRRLVVIGSSSRERSVVCAPRNGQREWSKGPTDELGGGTKRCYGSRSPANDCGPEPSALLGRDDRRLYRGGLWGCCGPRAVAVLLYSPL